MFESWYLFLISFIFLLVNIEVAELIAVLGVSNDVEPVTELLGLQVLLGQVLKVALAVAVSVGSDNNLVTSRVTGNGDGRAELTGLSVNLETVMQEVFESSNIENAVGGRASAIDGELGGGNSLVVLLLYKRKPSKDGFTINDPARKR
jgi:hypothetical protein